MPTDRAPVCFGFSQDADHPLRLFGGVDVEGAVSIMLLAMSAGIQITVLLMICQAVRSNASFCRAARSMVGSHVSAFKLRFRKRAKTKDERMMEAFLKQRRLERAQNMMYSSAALSTLVVAGQLGKFLYVCGSSLCNEDGERFMYRLEFIYDSEALPAVVFTVFALCCISHWKKVSERLLDKAHIAFFVLFAVKSATMSPRFHEFAVVWMGAVRMFFSLQFGNPILSSVLLPLACLVDMLAGLRNRTCTDGEPDLDLFNAVPHRGPLNIFVLLLSLSILWTLEFSTRSEARARIEETKSKGLESLVRKLLSGMCDAVAHLNADYKIQGGISQLQTLLMISDSQLSLEGRCFLDLFSDQERERVRAALDTLKRDPGASDAPSSAELLHSTMQDVKSGMCRSVQLFLASFFDGDEQLLLVGIMEDAERVPPPPSQMPMPRDRGRPTTLRDLQAAKDHIQAAQEAQRDGVLGTGAGVGHSHCSSPSSRQVDSARAGGAATVWFDAFSPELRVSKTSDAFSLITGGSVVGQGLADWLLVPDQRGLLRMVKQHLHKVHKQDVLPWRVEMDYSNDTAIWYAETEVGKVEVRSAEQPGVLFTARCVLEVPCLDGRPADDKSSPLIVAARLSQLRRRSRPPKNRAPQPNQAATPGLASDAVSPNPGSARGASPARGAAPGGSGGGGDGSEAASEPGAAAQRTEDRGGARVEEREPDDSRGGEDRRMLTSL